MAREVAAATTTTTASLDHHDDEHDDVEIDSRPGCLASCFVFFTSGTTLSNAVALAITTILLATGSYGTYRMDETLQFFGYNVYKSARIAAVITGCLSLGLLLVAGFLTLCLQRRWLYNWNGLFYLAEVKGWVGLFAGELFLLLFFYIPVLHMNLIVCDVALGKLILGVALVLTILMGIKGHLMQRVAMSFNYGNYRDRIQEALFAERMIQQLLAARHTYRVRQRAAQRVNETTFGFTLPAGIRPPTVQREGTGATVMVPSSTMADDDASSHVAGVDDGTIDRADQSTPRFKKHAITEQDKQQQFDAFFILANRTMAHFDTVPDPKAEISKEAVRIAGKIMKYLRPPTRDFLLPTDFVPWVEDEEEREGLLALFKRRADAVAINERDVVMMVEDTLSSRYGLAQSMKSIGAALDKINTLFTIAIITIVLVFVGIAVSEQAKNLVNAATTLLTAVTFVFGTSAKNMFESVIFLLIIHPFDVGDRVYIALGTSSADPIDDLLVMDMHLLSTVFERWDGVRIYVPNYVLATKAITNIRRSGPIVERTYLQVAMSTSVPILHELRRRLQEWLARQTTDFDPEYLRVNLESIEENAKLTLAIQIRHVDNWQDWERRMARRSKIVGHLKGLLEELGIIYLPPIQRVTLINSPAGTNPARIAE